MKFLVEHGAHKESRDNDNQTPLHVGIQEAIVGTDCLSLFLTYKLDINAQDSFGLTALHLAAMYNKESALFILKEAVARDLQDANGFTPLHFAALYGHPMSIVILKAFGVNEDIVNNEGQTPLDLARLNNHRECIELLEL